MMDFENSWIQIECPRCGFAFEITLRDVRLEEICYCHNCKCSVQIVDNYSSAHTGLNQMNDALRSLENTFNNLFK